MWDVSGSTNFSEASGDAGPTSILGGSFDGTSVAGGGGPVDSEVGEVGTVDNHPGMAPSGMTIDAVALFNTISSIGRIIGEARSADDNLSIIPNAGTTSDESAVTGDIFGMNSNVDINDHELTVDGVKLGKISITGTCTDVSGTGSIVGRSSGKACITDEDFGMVSDAGTTSACVGDDDCGIVSDETCKVDFDFGMSSKAGITTGAGCVDHKDFLKIFIIGRPADETCVTDEDCGTTLGDNPSAVGDTGKDSNVRDDKGVTDMHGGAAAIPGKPFEEDMAEDVKLDDVIRTSVQSNVFDAFLLQLNKLEIKR